MLVLVMRVMRVMLVLLLAAVLRCRTPLDEIPVSVVRDRPLSPMVMKASSSVAKSTI